jgi:exodeoxyribonuclease V gamma subunit
MIQVWYSNQLERLADRLVRHLAIAGGDRVSGLFARPPVVVPNPQIATYLKYECARTLGVAAGLTFHVSESFLATLLPPSQPPLRVVDRVTLRSLFLDALGEPHGKDRALPDPVRAYLDAAGDDPGACDLRRFQLATQLARLARQYGDTRPDLLRAWAAGRATLSEGPLAETEGWQRELWGRLVGTGGAIDRAQTAGNCRWVLPIELFGVLDQADGYAPPEEVHVFGFSYAWTGLRELLEHLGRASRVHVYALSLCAWRDHPGSEDLSAFGAWGRPGAEFAAMLHELDGVQVHEDFQDTSSATSLGRLQGEILRGLDPARNEPDGTLVVLACPGIRREAEVIAGEIWRLVGADDSRSGDGPGRLRFRDIGVLIADPKNRAAYQAHLRAAFDEAYGIPHNMVDLPLAGESRVIEAVLLLLALPLGSFTRPELLPLLIHPAVRSKFPGADADRWRAWCEQLEIVHGADRIDHAGTYIDRDLFHWEQGLRRLVLGAFLTGPRCGDDRGFPLDGSELLPQDEPVDAQADAARMLLLVRSLVADARFAREARLTMTEWSAFLARLITAYLAADTAADQRVLAECLSAAHALKWLDVGGEPVGYRIACESLREAIGGLTATKGHYLADGVAISPLLAMRALPFRVAFACGLGEGFFPASEGPNPLDLARARRHSGDVSPRERDQYLFLETLACTRERIYFSYVARDAQTGEDLESSPLVQELVRHLDWRHSPDAERTWFRKEPLRRYHGAEDPGTPVPVPAARREAQAERLRETFRRHCGNNPRMTPDMVWRLDPSLRDWLRVGPPYRSPTDATPARRLAVSLRDIRRFLECPLQGWARLMLRLREDQEDDPASREDEPFVTGRLSATLLLRDVFLDAFGAKWDGDDQAALEALYHARADALARTGVMPAGLFREADRRRHLSCLTAWGAVARRRGLIVSGPYVVHRFGRAAENERVDALGPPISIDVPLPGGGGTPEIVRVELYGRTEMVSAKLPGSLTCVDRDTPKDKDLLGGFLDAVALSLIRHHDPAEYHVHVLTGSSGGNGDASQRRLCGIDEARARDYLTGVLAEMLGEPHAYLLPCEAVFANLTKGTRIAESVETMKESDRAACSSRYGPVPDFSLYDPPDDAEAEAMIDRRYGLFRECGGVVV